MTERQNITATVDHFWRELKLIDGPLRWLYWAIGLFSIWSYQRGDLNAGAILGLLLYMGLNIVLIRSLPRAVPNTRRFLAIILYGVDLLFVSFLIYHTGGLVSQFYLLYCLLVFKAAIYYPYVHPIILVPFLIFPLYVITLYLSTGTLVFLLDRLFVSRYTLLFAVILSGLYTAWLLDSRHRRTRALLEQLESEHRKTVERRRELRAILDSIGDGVIVVDQELRLLIINPVAAEVFDLSYPQGPGVLLNGLIDNPNLLALLGEALGKTEAKEASISNEIKVNPTSSDKPILYQALATTLVGEQDTPHGAIVVLRDITRQRELEESKTNFISMLSHELRTPLTAIRGFVDLILSGGAGDITPEQREYMEIVSDQSEHLESLINALLEFAEMEVAETSLQMDFLSADKLIHSTLGQIEALAKERSIALQAHVPADLAPLFADGLRLEQVLFNLLDNAIKFSPANGVVTVTVTDYESEVKICVTDTGRGVPRAERNLIFERFYQIDSSSTREHGGTGLGLALCKHIVESHRGHIWVEQPTEIEEGNDNLGSRFCFTIPRDLAKINLADESVLDDPPPSCSASPLQQVVL